MNIKKFFTASVLAALLGAFMPLSAATDAQAEEFTLLAAVVSDKGNIWLPSTINTKEGQEITHHLRNLVGKQHGFTLDGMGVKVMLEPGQSKSITITPKKKGVFRYYCHLHKGHVGGQLLVD